jgi:heme/copper-type cytochrome/quinol oxidase subunit 1
MNTVNSTATAGHASTSSALGTVANWITTTDHKKIGRLFVGASALWMLVIVGVGAALGVERIASDSAIFNLNSITQLFAMLRTGATFGVLLPLALGFGIAVVPTQVGSKSLSFARLAMFGFYAWLIASGLVIGSIIANGGPGGGNPQMVDLYLMGVGVGVVGAIAASVSLVATVLTSRRTGLSLLEIPMFSWSVFVSAISLVLTLPVLLGSLIYVAVDHHYARLAFGGNKGIDMWLGWGFSQPQTFLYVIPAIGLLAELAPISARIRQPLRGAMLVGVGIVSTAMFGTVTQTSHVFVWSGSLIDKLKSAIPYAWFNLLPILGVVIVILLSLLAIQKGKKRLIAPLVPTFLGVGMILVGMAGNALQMIDSAKLSGSVFEEAAVTYIAYGAMLCAWGAIAYFGPALWGRKIPDISVIGIGVLGLFATVLAAFPYYLAKDQVAGEVSDFDYSGPQAVFNAAVSLGHVLMLFCLLSAIAVSIKSLSSGETVSATVWSDQ